MFRRKLKAIDTDAFHTDLSQIWIDQPDMTVTELNAHITSFLNKHAPVTKYIQKKRKKKGGEKKERKERLGLLRRFF